MGSVIPEDEANQQALPLLDELVHEDRERDSGAVSCGQRGRFCHTSGPGAGHEYSQICDRRRHHKGLHWNGLQGGNALVWGGDDAGCA